MQWYQEKGEGGNGKSLISYGIYEDQIKIIGDDLHRLLRQSLAHSRCSSWEKEKGMAAPTLKATGNVGRKQKGSQVFPKEGGQQRSENSALQLCPLPKGKSSVRHKEFPTAPRTWHPPGGASSASPPGSQGSRDLAVQTRGHHADTLPSDTRKKKRRRYCSTHLSGSLWPTCTQKVKDTPQGPYLTPSFLTTKAFICWLMEPSLCLPSLLSPYVSSCLHCSHIASSSGYLCRSLHLESSFFMWFNPVHLDLSS